jgi:hypothetical protein
VEARRPRRHAAGEGTARSKGIKPRLQAGRHLRRRVRIHDALPLFDLRRRGRSAADHTPKIIILGSGPNRIGQGIEFDYCCCHAAFALKDDGYETIMVNCNPETVSTDYDTSDRLYFEPLVLEDVLAVYNHEAQSGARDRHDRPVRRADAAQPGAAPARAGVPIIGTSPESIDLAEDRKRFGKLLDELEIPQPQAAPPPAWKKLWPSASASATRCWSGPATCSAAAPWSSPTTPKPSPST